MPVSNFPAYLLMSHDWKWESNILSKSILAVLFDKWENIPGANEIKVEAVDFDFDFTFLFADCLSMWSDNRTPAIYSDGALCICKCLSVSIQFV